MASETLLQNTAYRIPSFESTYFTLSKELLLDPSSPSLYITILSVISTVCSMYGMLVIFHAAKEYMRHQKLGMKFLAVKIAVIVLNIQTAVFGIMARFDVPPCIKFRGPKIRASNINHGVIILELFLLSLLARYAYRRPEPNSEVDGKPTEISVKYNAEPHRPAECKTIQSNEITLEEISELGTSGKYTTYDNPITVTS